MIFQQLNFNDKGAVKKTSRLFQSPQNAQTFLGSKIFSPTGNYSRDSGAWNRGNRETE